MRSRIKELKQGAMYNVLHTAILGGYAGPATPENFWDWAHEETESSEKNYATLLLSLINEDNYPTGGCGVISGDALDLALQIGLFQGPHITVVDRRYEMAGACRTKVVNGMCRIDEWDGIKI